MAEYNVSEVLKKKTKESIDNWKKTADEYMDALVGFMEAGFTREEAMQFVTIIANIYMSAVTDNVNIMEVK